MHQTIASLAVKFSGALISYLLTVYISRTYGNEQLGYFSFLLSYSLVFLLILKFGTDIYLMKWTSRFFANGENGKAAGLYRKLLSYHLLTGLLLTLLCIAITPFLLEHFFSRYKDVRFFEIGVISLFFMNLHILNYEFLRGTQRLVSYTFYHTVSIFLITILINLLLAQVNLFSERTLEIAYVSAVIISFFISFVHVLAVLSKQNTSSVDQLSIPRILQDSFPFFSNNAVLVLIGTIDVFMLSNYVSPAVVGEYAIIVKIATFVSFPLVVLGSNFSPKIAGFKNRTELETEKQRTTRIIGVITLLIFLSIIAILSPVTNYLTITHVRSVAVYLLIGSGFVISSFFSLNEVCLQMMGQEKLYQNVMLAACFFNFILNLLLIPVWKELGSAMASVLTFLFWNAAAAYFVRKRLNLSPGLIFRL